jgi:hypothetical protein
MLLAGLVMRAQHVASDSPIAVDCNFYRHPSAPENSCAAGESGKLK